MLFCTLDYLFFFIGMFAVYWAMPWPKARVWLLVVGSFFFYACFNKWLALLIGLSTAVDYFIALGIDALNAPQRRRKLLLILSIIANLGLLCFFKYANFFLQSSLDIWQALGHPLGDKERAAWILNVILPVGISFYTFEAINYVVDVYLRKAKAERNLAHFMLFITFFPHLVAGPIVRARDFLPQIRRRKHFSWLRLYVGLLLVVLGLVKKVIADRMAQFSDPVFGPLDVCGTPLTYRTGAVWLAIIGYAIQLYCDFSGYTDIAIGCAHLLGYHLAKNFDMPYISLNIAEYWRRWHISLSSWLRDYLFIPLGGSRGGFWMNSRNLFITFTLAGLWHGAAWHFVCFGVLQGMLLTIHRAFKDYATARPRLNDWLQTATGVFLRWGVTITCILLGYVLFRAPTFTHAANFYYRMFNAGPSGLRESPMPNAGLWLVVAVVVGAHYAGVRRLWERLSWRLPAPVLGACCVVAVTIALMLSPDGTKPFIYFDF
jgi:alginate O-acetyltransferase complex protein AlgI